MADAKTTAMCWKGLLMESTTLLATLVLPDAPGPVDPASLFALLALLPDPRKRRGRRYTLAAVLTVIVLAKLAGETSMSGIAHWARLRAAWLCPLLQIAHGRLPCANPYTLLCSKVDVVALNPRLAQFFVPPLPALPATSAGGALAAAPPTRASRHLALDGKSLRGTRRSGNVTQPAVHLLSLYDVTHQGTLAQTEVATKEHEIPGASALIAGRDLRGCVLTADALHTQRQWCRRVRAQGGDYVLIAKKNQRGLLQDIALLFEGAWPAWLEQRSATTVNKGHGRVELRQLWASTELNGYLGGQWTDVAQVFQIEREIVRQGKRTHEVVCGLTSLPAEEVGPDGLLGLVRAHWQLENRGHWRRDVTLGEDGCQVKQGKAAQVLAALNNGVLMLMDRLGVKHVAAQMREFAADPLAAVALLFGSS
jgi:predicted transposase YbfD/YdcC